MADGAPKGEALVLPEMANAESTTAGAFTNGRRPLGGSAPAIDPASRVSVSERTGYVKEDGRFSLKAGTESKSAAALQEEDRLLRCLSAAHITQADLSDGSRARLSGSCSGPQNRRLP